MLDDFDSSLEEPVLLRPADDLLLDVEGRRLVHGLVCAGYSRFVFRVIHLV